MQCIRRSRANSVAFVAVVSLVALTVSCGDGGGGPGGTGGTAGSASGGGAADGSGGLSSGGAGGTPPVATGGGVGSGGAPGVGGAPATGGAPDGSGGAASGGSGGGGVSADATFIPDPSWSCGRPEGIVAPQLGTLVFTATLEVGDVHDVGTTQYGDRRVLSLGGGPVEGELQGEFLAGGLDFALTLAGGAVELEHVDLIESSDGSRIYMRTCGLGPAGADELRFVPDFEAPNGSSVAWLNTGDFVGIRRLDEGQSTLTLEVYDVAEAEPGAEEVVFSDPAEVPHQPWECNMQTGSKGASVFTETVLISSSLSIGASKYGTRNAIPITGGTVSGGFSGIVVPAGADYQLTSGGSSTVLDARYLLESSDGELLVVRNCGPFGALIPWFEARADGPLGYLNEGSYLSSDPGGASGGVSITFYERQ